MIRPLNYTLVDNNNIRVARVLATSPKIITLDEPTSALDLFLQGKIEETLYGLKDKYTMLCSDTRSMQQAYTYLW